VRVGPGNFYPDEGDIDFVKANSSIAKSGIRTC